MPDTDCPIADDPPGGRPRADPADGGAEVSRLYARRFQDLGAYRSGVWRVLAGEYFSQWVPREARVLDLGCGHGEFINNVVAGWRAAMDLNPDAESLVDDGVSVVIQDCSAPWPDDLRDLDVVFSSNFFEHLPSKEALRRTLDHALDRLRPGGRLIALGPNIRLTGGDYWDFIDHHLPLTDRSIAELLADVGFEIERVVPAFLPYTMSGGRQPPIWMLRLYLRLPIAWRFVGKQFLVVARRKPGAADEHPVA